LELRNDIVNTELINSITPDVNAYAASYKTLLDYDEEERVMHVDPKAHLEFLIKNINIAVNLLKKTVCNNGYLDLSKLRNILYKLNAQVAKKGRMHIANDAIVYDKAPYMRYDTPPSVPLFASIMSTSEPFEDKPVNIRAASRIEGMTPLQSTDRLIYTNDYTAPHMPYQPLDGSFEGSTNRDIMNGLPIGNTISRTSDPSHYYTVRSGACGGTTPSDDQFMSQCLGKDLQLESALNGDPSSMLDCIGGSCTSDANYFRWYKQLDETLANTYSYN
jgi:hypothetical protein